MQYPSAQVDTAAGWQGAHWKWWAGHIRAHWSTQICMQSLRFLCCGCDLTSDCFPMERKTQAKLEHTPVYYASHGCKWALFAEGTAGFSPDPQGFHKHLWAFESAQSPNWHAAWKTRHSKLIQISQLKKRQTQIMTKAVLFSHPCSIMLLFCTVEPVDKRLIQILHFFDGRFQGFEERQAKQASTLTQIYNRESRVLSGWCFTDKSRYLLPKGSKGQLWSSYISYSILPARASIGLL